MKNLNFGVWWPGEGWMHCPITGEQIRGTRARMRQYAKDMSFLGWHVRPTGKPTTGFVCKKIEVVHGL